MQVGLVIFGIVAVGACYWLCKIYWRKKTIKRLYATPLPEFAEAILNERVPLYRRVPRELKPQLQGHINYFLHDKAFVGCNGQEINDEIRLTVAGNACLLVLNRRESIFPGFTTILIYPDTYIATEISYDGLVENHGKSVRLGESWQRGPVVLSWSDVVAGSHNPDDGHNVVLHEFAHKLDEENALMDGLPILRDKFQYARWAEVLSREFDAFVERVKQHENRVIDGYGAVSAAEFFAVITETFFEKPQQMKENLPELYDQLQNYYQVDTVAWRETP